MNAIGKLIKSKTISFPNVLIKNYQKIGLNEVNTVVIIKLYYLAEENDNFLRLNELVKSMTIEINELSNMIISLVDRGYINLEVDNEGREQFNLDGTIEKLGAILDDNDETENGKQKMIESIISYVESTYGRVANVSDLTIINNWIDLGYKYDDIRNEILQSLKAKKMHLKYADAILATRKLNQPEKRMEVDDEIKELLDNAVKKRWYDSDLESIGYNVP